MTSTIKVNNVQNQCGQNIINENSNTITIGASGDTIALASGASQTGFGRTGTVDWQTGSIKTSTFTAVNGEGYFANTSGGAFTMNLPAGSAGAIVSVVDYTNTFQTNGLTISPNGAEKIGGVAAPFVAAVEGQSLTFVYVDATEGWKNIQDSTTAAVGNPFIVATGGTITTCGNFKIHTFTGPGTFTVSQVSATAAENTVGYMVVAGGGGGGPGSRGGGGGAGGYREGRNVPVDNFTASPLVADAPTNAVTVTATSFPITVGAGGIAGCSGNGSNSIFSTITSTGGGRGVTPTPSPLANGGSGGGGCGRNPLTGGTGNTPSVSPSQGNNGGNSSGSTSSPDIYAGGGGGGAGAAGSPNPSATQAGAGGAGVSTSITGSSVTRAGGGGGGSGSAVVNSGSGGAGGSGGGGPGGSGSGGAPTRDGTNGTANTGGGGGGNAYTSSPPGSGTAGNGGSGIVIIRYKFQ